MFDKENCFLMKYGGGENSNMRNLLTYFPAEHTRPCLVPRDLCTDRRVSSKAELTAHSPPGWAHHCWRQFFEKDGKEQQALYSPKEGCFWNSTPTLHQNIVISRKQSQQQWWVTMYNQEHAWDEQLPVVSIVSVHCFSKVLFVRRKSRE